MSTSRKLPLCYWYCFVASAEKTDQRPKTVRGAVYFSTDKYCLKSLKFDSDTLLVISDSLEQYHNSGN